MNLISDMAGAALGALLLVLFCYGFVLLGGIALYVLRSWGLFVMAERRGIRKAWMAWVPVLNLWVLGSLSDQYRYVVRRQFRNRRKWLLGLSVAGLALALAAFCVYVVGIASAVVGLTKVQSYQDFLAMMGYQPILVAAAGVSAVAAAVKLLLTILRWTCLHDIYGSSRPEKKALYTLLSILLPVTAPFLLFVCREKDAGMPPRKNA